MNSPASPQVDEWPIGPNGLMYDREWALVAVEGMGADPAAGGGRVLTQKACPRMAAIRCRLGIGHILLVNESSWCPPARFP